MKNRFSCKQEKHQEEIYRDYRKYLVGYWGKCSNQKVLKHWN